MCYKKISIKSFKGVSRMFQWSFVVQLCSRMYLIAATRAEGGLVFFFTNLCYTRPNLELNLGGFLQILTCKIDHRLVVLSKKCLKQNSFETHIFFNPEILWTPIFFHLSWPVLFRKEVSACLSVCLFVCFWNSRSLSCLRS